MKLERSYQIALFSAIFLHVALLLGFVIQPAHKTPVMALEAKRESKVVPKEEEIVKAVSVKSEEVQEVVKRLKNEREAAARAEAKKQKELAAKAEAARARRVAEQKRLERLRAENARAEAKRKALAAAEQKRLQEVKKQKEIEAKKLSELKKEQLALKQKQEEEDMRRAEQAREEKARQEAANRARLSGVVDKYKALILGAISQQWILPDQVDTSLSSRFKIRLAPNGSVLDVQLTRSSGSAVLDRSAEAAIYKASPLPVPSDPETFSVFREISLTVRPENVRG